MTGHVDVLGTDLFRDHHRLVAAQVTGAALDAGHRSRMSQGFDAVIASFRVIPRAIT